MDEVVLRGRDPALLLSDIDKQGNVTHKSVKVWGDELFKKIQQVALLLDNAYQCTKYSESITREWEKVTDSNLTPSAKMLAIIQEQKLSEYSLAQAKTYQAAAAKRDYQFYSEEYFLRSVPKSHAEQLALERKDNIDFDTFLADYFKA